MNKRTPENQTDIIEDWAKPTFPAPAYAPDMLEIALADKNLKELAVIQRNIKATKALEAEETKDQRKAFQLWYRQHLSGLFKAEQVDAAVAQVLGRDIGSIRSWKTAFGWSKRMENLKKEEKAEEKLLLYAKNEAIEHGSLDVVLRYLAYIQSLDSSKIEIHHVKMMMQLVEFSQKNKGIMDAPGQTISAAGVSLTIQQN